jgi:pimeloyl-[acyl-carrier protein] methyl ester esterase
VSRAVNVTDRKAAGSSILILPGLNGTAEFLMPLAEALAPRYRARVLAYPPDKAWDYEALADYALAHAPDGRFVVLGESFSSPLAVEIAAREPRVAGLILAAGFLRSPLPRAFSALVEVFDVRWSPHWMVHRAMLGAFGSRDLSARLERSVANTPHRVLVARLKAVLSVDKRERLSEVACPVLCLRGAHDRMIGPAHLREMLAARPDAEVVTFDAPHMLLETHPHEAATAISAFCDGLG